ncbi:hypothetical protein LCGC14_2650300 [marine sediment metagenome]|uniref:Uncharacterized protein n=1 Tax=marine sediment metagenome TaxID=412755 RepID=A0A0F8ZUW8_9ZZZZ
MEQELKPVVYVSHGVANRYSDCIEINKNLKKYPILLNPILEHENQHTDEFITKKDLKLDFMSRTVHTFEMLKFMLKHPASFTQILPIGFRKGKITYDVNVFIFWAVMLGMIFGGIYIGGLL